ncbi:Inducer of phenazine A [Plantactinospora sp. WMMC1484]|uniref:Inducer of phenazine A n=1 Tax=Plantactinospora sp. WMMC1484 TaxID=3404122 RepID=UPI003BF4B91F
MTSEGGPTVVRHSELLTPQTADYLAFLDREKMVYLPYLMYFNRPNFRSTAINTDQFGFRMSHGPDGRASVGDHRLDGPVRLLVGGSGVLGYGATSDAATLPSRLWTKHAPSRPWLNFGAPYFNSTQELILFMLYRHLLPPVDEIVLFSGFNNLVMAQLNHLPLHGQGAFFFCNEYFEKMQELRKRYAKPVKGPRWRTGPKSTPEPVSPSQPTPATMIEAAVELTTRHLDSWLVMAGATNARVSFVLQPLASWVRQEPADQEKLLFDEFDRFSEYGTWEERYGLVGSRATGAAYAAALATACAGRGVPFVDMNSRLAAAVTAEDWLFVDRGHFTDDGNEIMAGLLAESLALS